MKMRKNYEQRVQNFQNRQAEKKALDDQVFRDTFNSERKAYVTEMANNARCKAFNDLDEQRKKGKVWLQRYQDDIAKRLDKKKKLEELEQGMLDLANQQEEVFHEMRDKQKVVDTKRVMDTGAKQQKAAQWLKENVFDKIVDDEDERIRRDLAKQKQREEMAALAEAKRKEDIVQSLMNFHKADRKIKKERKIRAEEEKVEDKVKNQVMFREFIEQLGLEHAKKMSTIQIYTKFWDDQCLKLNQQRRQNRRAEEDLIKAVKLNEAVDQENIEVKAEDIIRVQVY